MFQGREAPLFCGTQVLLQCCQQLVCFLRHGGPPPKALHQGGLTMGSVSVQGEPKFSEGAASIYKPSQGEKHCMSCTMGLKR